jgi:hypothetical protein
LNLLEPDMSVEIPDSDALCRKRRSQYQTLGRIAAMLAMLPLIAPVVGMTLLWLAHRFDWPAWILGIIGLLAIAGVWYVGWRMLCVHGFRFSLRTGLIAFALAGVLSGLAGRWFLRTWRHAEAVAEVTGGGGGYVDYGFSSDFSDVERNWLQADIGYDPFASVECINVRRDRAIVALVQHREEFSDLEWLSFRWVTDAGLQHAADLDRFPRLANAEFNGSELTDAGMAHLAKWTNLRELWFSECGNFTDDGLAHLVKLPNLASLTFFDQGTVKMSVTDAGLAHVGRMRQLKFLRIAHVPITDQGVRHLHGLSNLEELWLQGTSVTEQGLEELYRALPDCLIRTDTESLPQTVQIRQLTVWDVRSPSRHLARIVDPERISKIRRLLHHHVTSYQGTARTDSGLHIEFSLDGLHRSLRQFRVGKRELHVRVRTRWSHRSISDQQTEELLDLLGLDIALLGGNDD